MEKIDSNSSHFSEIQNNNLSERRIGSAVLSSASFDSSHKDIVESSFNKARVNGEKLPGKNNERRNFAYLSRLEKLINKHGNALEKRLWKASVKSGLLIKYNNVTDSYWESKKQELRDNGYGNIELTDEYKHKLFNAERRIQEESLEKWVNYFSDEQSPYPLWFKVYAWDGMTKMGKYDKSKGCYAVRNKSTVAPYPYPNAEILGGVFDVVNRYFGNDEKKIYTEEGERNIKLESIIQSGSFPKIYNAIQRDIAPIIEPPEKAEDVHGTWIEYGIGEEDEIARAAGGTGWCVASSSVGRHYLEYGTYGDDDAHDDLEDDDYYYPNDDEEKIESRAKFILFHLEDPSTGGLSKNAVASIRLDQDGNVAEISGLKDGQALNDSLIGIVEKKVKSLPGGEKFLDAFADKQELIRLDHKMINNEDLSKEELEFIYEINRPIHTLDTYNWCDPRATELRSRYNVRYAYDAGLDLNVLASKLHSPDIAKNLDTLVELGVSIDFHDLISNLPSEDLTVNLESIVRNGGDINEIIKTRFDSDDVFENLDLCLKCGANADLVTSKLDDDVIPYHFEKLVSRGANIDLNELFPRLDSQAIVKSLDVLVKHGIDIKDILSKLTYEDTTNNMETLIGYCGDINDVIPHIWSDYIRNNLDALIDRGASIDVILPKLGCIYIAENYQRLRNYNADIDTDKLVDEITSNSFTYLIPTLLSDGIDINSILSSLIRHHNICDQIFEYLSDSKYDGQALCDEICKQDVDLFNRYSRYDCDRYMRLSPLRLISSSKNLESILENGANPEDIASRLYYKYALFDQDRKNIGSLLQYGLDGNLAHEYISVLGDRKETEMLLNANFNALLDNGLSLENISVWDVDHVRLDNMKNMLKKYGYDEILKHFDGQSSEYWRENFEHTLAANAIFVKECAKQAFDKLPDNFFGDGRYDHYSEKKIGALLENGININDIFEKLDIYTINRDAEFLLEKGISPDALLDRFIKMDYSLSRKSAEMLFSAGADVDKLISYDSATNYFYRLDLYLQYTDIQHIVNSAQPIFMWHNIKQLKELGAHIDLLELFRKSGSDQNLVIKQAVEAGLDINEIAKNLSSESLAALDDHGRNKLREDLLKHGADPSIIDTLLPSPLV